MDAVMDGPVLVFGGPYSNLQATAAVLAEAGRRGIPPERIVCTGDVVAYGAAARETVALVRRAGIRVVRGNCEESLGQSGPDCGCGFAPGSACDLLTPEAGGLRIEHVALAYNHAAAARDMRAAGLPEGYAAALETGLWPSCDVLPPAELKAAGVPLAPGSLTWRRGDLREASWPAPAAPIRLDPRKFRDPAVTAKGEARARVALDKLDTLWINTGTLCNLACANCYIESSPRNDRLAYVTAGEVAAYLDEIERDALGTTLIGFTGGEPFMNRELPAMIEDALARGFRV